MKKLILISVLSGLSFIIGYSQSKEILQIETDIEYYLLKNPINNSQRFTDYRNIQNEIARIRNTSKNKLKKKDNLILDALNRKLADSVYMYLQREEEFRKINLERERRVRIYVDSLRKDSIKKVEIALEIKLAQQDSIRRKTRQDFFSVESIVKNIGKTAYSKDNIENTLSIYPSAFKGTWTFYDVSDKFISIKYFGLEDICIELGFRIFGEDAALYKKELMQAGFKYQKTFRETMIENHSQGYSNLLGTEIQRYRKYTGKDYVICDIYYDKFTFFKFYRARYKR
jgi:hypothetical protein